MAARDIIQAAAGAAGATEANYIEDVFQTYLYTGNGSTQTINNGIDLATKGGMVWIKRRDVTGNHIILDTARGTGKMLMPDLTAAQDPTPQALTSFNANGFTVGSYILTNGESNSTVAWTFRKQPKFFDVVTYTGNGATQTIAHNLGATPGMIIVKKTSGTGNWAVVARASNDTYMGAFGLNSTAQAYVTNVTKSDVATSTTFDVGYMANNFEGGLNASGSTYVAYLFAHNAGGFGPAGTDSVVACGSFTASSLTSVSLGWEPQFVLLKKSSFISDWYLLDVMRGLDQTNSQYLRANSSSIEGSNPTPIIPTATGFNYIGTNFNDTSGTYIYLAIRRGPMKTPTDATKVFAPVAQNAASNGVVTTGFPVDLSIAAERSRANYANTMFIDRLRGTSISTFNRLLSQTTDAEFSSNNGYGLGFDYNTSIKDNIWNSIFGTSGGISYLNFRRAPGFFDVVCYTGTGSATTVAHNLGVAPELMIVKRRDLAGDWYAYENVWYGAAGFMAFQSPFGTDISATYWNNTTATSSVFSLGTNVGVNASGSTYVAYLFATCPGVSKVFSFTGNGSSQTIDCGFTTGARFVLIKRTDSGGNWYVWDTARGIVAGNDPHLSLNSSAAEVTTNDTIDTAGSGFIVNQVAATNVNVNNAIYIGLAIA